MQHSKERQVTIKLNNRECEALSGLLEIARVSLANRSAEEKFHETKQEEDDRMAMMSVMNQLFDILS